MSQEKHESKQQSNPNKPKKYNPLTDEKQWQEFWEKNKTYAFDPDSTKPIYSIDTPPPTVSGKMHLGHAFSYAQQDFIARYHRMKGENVFYPFGTDDNGLATERLIEKKKKVKSKKMKRADFIKLCNETLKEIRPEFIQGWKDIGMSCDFNIFYSTINDHSRTISQRSFIELYKAGREYQKEAPTIWCTKCQTAIAQVELEDEEHDSSFNDIIFKIKDKDNNEADLLIGTTRPEMLGSCVAIFVHPEDDRYKELVGKKAKVPLFNHEIPIKADQRADPEKGTGAVMCCTFGDQTDIEWYKAHNLPLVMSINDAGIMTKVAGKYEGMKVEEAKKAVIADLKEANLLVKEKPIKHAVNVHERCATPVQILNTKQWFIRYLDLKEHFIEAGKQMHWYPQHMRVRYDNWIKGLQWDWCISRQRYFGVPFPMWYCKKCNEPILADIDQLPVDPLVDKPTQTCKCGSTEIRPEEDVLDTWATSSLTPLLAIELFKDHKNYKSLRKKLFPMNLRPQAHDIITFWLFNTVVKSQLHEQTNPWDDIMIAGHALDPKGRKMSKSKGNVIAPQEMITKYGADCLRFWAAASKLGDDLPFMEKDLVTGKKMINKLWNASSFCIMHLQDFKTNNETNNLTVMDRWLLSKLQRMIIEATDSFEEYEYAKTRAKTEQFFWHTFCDYYLEIVKDRIYNPDRRGKEGREAAQYCLYNGIFTVLKLMAPIMPHITEAIYQEHFVKKEKEVSIHTSLWPAAQISLINEEAETVGDAVIEIIAAVRKQKSEKSLSLKAEIKKLTITAPKMLHSGIEEAMGDLKTTTASLEVVLVEGEELTVEGEF
jgi:valyl-tRNA synthetase